jgi:protease-4
MNPLDLPRNGVLAVRNLARSLRRRGLDYLALPIEGSLPERTPRRPGLPFPFSLLPLFPSEVSLEGLKYAFDMIGADSRVKGVVFQIEHLQAGPATLHAVRRMILTLREQGKRTIAWLPDVHNWDYYLATACDAIAFPPCARLNVLGLRSEALFLKETLELVGIEADLESIAEYKVAPDMFRRSSMTEPHREMLDAILDSYFEELVDAIAEGRGLPPEQVRAIIDNMPMGPERAVEAGLGDVVAYSDELGEYLAPGDDAAPMITGWDEAARWLKRPVQWVTRRRIGVVSVDGVIVPGRSRRLPVPLPLPIEAQAGAQTVIQALRRAESDPRIAAVVLHVDSPGGSSLASDLIWREARRLRERKPVVALMGEQAASGGYYVCAAANHIVARPTTMTGSIGIWGGKFVAGQLYGRLRMGRAEIKRGATAGFTSELRPFSAEERRRIRQELGEAYARFKQVVAEGRGMTDEEVERIARGRVWTGEQAVDLGLVDELGDFDRTLTVAKELANLDPEKEYSVVQILAPGKTLLPMGFPDDGASTWPNLVRTLQDLARERLWAMSPWLVRVRG